MSGDLTSTITNIQYLDNIGLQLVFTGTPTGSFFVDVSIDHSQSPPTETVTNNGTWTPITFTSSPVASGAAGNIYIDLNQLSAPWLRVRYVRDSGSGTLNAYVAAKML